jgi:hypothetical protein
LNIANRVTKLGVVAARGVDRNLTRLYFPTAYPAILRSRELASPEAYYSKCTYPSNQPTLHIATA